MTTKKFQNEKTKLANALYASAGYHVMVQGNFYYLINDDGSETSKTPLAKLQNLDDVIHHIQELSFANGFSAGQTRLRNAFRELMRIPPLQGDTKTAMS